MLVETVSKKPIAPHVKDIVFEMMVDDDQGEDVEVCSSLPGAFKQYADPVLLPGSLPQGPRPMIFCGPASSLRIHLLYPRSPLTPKIVAQHWRVCLPARRPY